ncbi:MULTISPECIES: hypothetical protein [Actinomyces]|uniref:Uncharacterized protein n=1 Tax=Actinomyces respiraculi TaxID=2744574 RepID=A0A7T0PW78_9ACTO|nr:MULTISPECIES: hypothetical protein [Actinomyces]QPL04565.1 hypothetical protein ID810_07075 [Actinomyces respiraculi]
MLGTIIFIAIFGGGFVIFSVYTKFLTQGMATRVVVTTLPADRVREVFVQKVAGSTWKITDDGNPMIAQSPLITGIRQQIALETDQDAGRCRATVEVIRWSEKYGAPNKAYTLRMRLDAFVKEIQLLDPSAQVTTRPLDD